MRHHCAICLFFIISAVAESIHNLTTVRVAVLRFCRQKKMFAQNAMRRLSVHFGFDASRQKSILADIIRFVSLTHTEEDTSDADVRSRKVMSTYVCPSYVCVACVVVPEKPLL